jgi:hypothetical protein
MAVQAAVGLIVMLLELQHKQVRAELVMETQAVLVVQVLTLMAAAAVVALALLAVMEVVRNLVMVALV